VEDRRPGDSPAARRSRDQEDHRPHAALGPALPLRRRGAIRRLADGKWLALAAGTTPPPFSRKGKHRHLSRLGHGSRGRVEEPHDRQPAGRRQPALHSRRPRRALWAPRPSPRPRRIHQAHARRACDWPGHAVARRRRSLAAGLAFLARWPEALLPRRGSRPHEDFPRRRRWHRRDCARQRRHQQRARRRRENSCSSSARPSAPR